MSSTRATQHINAPRSAVYAALLDANAIANWKVPDGMSAEIHQFEPRVGGSIRVSLTYSDKISKGKSSSHTDTYHGTFTELVANEKVVEVDEFETDDASMQGAMTITITLADANGGTDLFAVHDGLPSGVSAADNETGWKMSLGKLAKLVERKQ